MIKICLLGTAATLLFAGVVAKSRRVELPQASPDRFMVTLPEPKSVPILPIEQENSVSSNSPAWSRSLENLPSRLVEIFEGVLRKHLQPWGELEAALLAKADGLIPALLRRYEAEPDPAYKGLLAALLAADPSTHDRLKEDFRTFDDFEGDVFRSLVLVGLILDRARSPEEARSDDNLQRWWVLTSYFHLEAQGLRRERLRKDNPAVRSAVMNCGWLREWLAVKELLGPVVPGDREWFLEILDREWPYYGIHRVARAAIEEASKLDSNVADEVLGRYLDSGTRGRVLMGLQLTDEATLTPKGLEILDRQVATFFRDPEVLGQAAAVLARQVSPQAQATLRTLYRLSPDFDSRLRVVDAVSWYGKDAYGDVARTESRSEHAELRICAARILAQTGLRSDQEEVMSLVAHDPVAKVRYYALASLERPSKTEPLVQAAIHRAALADTDERIKALAQSMLNPDAGIKFISSFMWDLPEPGEEE